MTIKILGDPHLGKRFVEGVPLHRRGEREDRQWTKFESSLWNVELGDVHVCMGDLFDSYSVDEATVLRAARNYIAAAKENPNVGYYVLRGNHDAVRDAMKNSSFDVFRELVSTQSNIIVVAKQAINTEQGYAFFPWHPFMTAAEVASQINSARVAFGHWDLRPFPNSENTNLLPFDILKKMGVEEVYTGHEHKPFQTKVDGIWIIGTGSMMPYAHGEGDLYVTVALADLGDPAQYKDKCLRVLLRPGEELPEIDCLQLTVKRVEGEEIEQVTFEEFDLKGLFDTVMAEKSVGCQVSNEVWGFYENARSAM